MRSLKEIIEEAKELGIESVEFEGVKYTLGKNEIPRNSYVPEVKAEEIMTPMPIFEELTDDEIKYWATPYYDELQAKKAAQSEQKQIDQSLKDAN